MSRYGPGAPPLRLSPHPFEERVTLCLSETRLLSETEAPGVGAVLTRSRFEPEIHQLHLPSPQAPACTMGRARPERVQPWSRAASAVGSPVFPASAGPRGPVGTRRRPADDQHSPTWPGWARSSSARLEPESQADCVVSVTSQGGLTERGHMSVKSTTALHSGWSSLWGESREGPHSPAETLRGGSR